MNSAFDNDLYELSQKVGESLKRYNHILGIAESCTGGWIAQAITMVPGSSMWFDSGFVTYSNQSKIKFLGVNETTIDQFGAVSKPVVEAMVKGVLRNTEATCAVATTGIAGPDGGTKDKPVGTVWISIGLTKYRIESTALTLTGDRNAIRYQTVIYTLKALMDGLHDI